MPRLVDYHCFTCGRNTDDVYYQVPGAVKDKIKCQCGGTAVKRLACPQIYIDDWSPMTNDAQRDIEHFEKKSKGRLYRIDETKQSVNHLVNYQGW